MEVSPLCLYQNIQLTFALNPRHRLEDSGQSALSRKIRLVTTDGGMDRSDFAAHGFHIAILSSPARAHYRFPHLELPFVHAPPALTLRTVAGQPGVAHSSATLGKALEFHA